MRSTALLVALAAVALSSPSFAQQHQMPRGKPTPVITESEISGVPGHQLRVITNDFVAGAGTPRHVHPGDQWTVVQTGEVTMIVNDGEAKVMKVGEMVRIPPARRMKPITALPSQRGRWKSSCWKKASPASR